MIALLLTVLKVLGWVLLALLLLLVVLLVLPFRAYILYENSAMKVSIGALGLRFCVFDSKKKRTKKGKKSSETDKTEEGQAEPEDAEQKEKSHVDFKLIRFLIGEGVGVAGRILHALHLQNLEVRLIASGEDPCETGISAGRMWSFVGSALSAMLVAWPNMTVNELTVIPDFAHEHEGKERLYIEIYTFPIAAVAAAAVFAIRFLKFTLSRRRKIDSATDTERMCEQ